VTVAAHCEVPAVSTEVGLQETETEVIVVASVTFSVLVPVMLVFETDAAVTVTVAAVAGAVNNPEELIDPALPDHVTDEL